MSPFYLWRSFLNQTGLFFCHCFHVTKILWNNFLFAQVRLSLNVDMASLVCNGNCHSFLLGLRFGELLQNPKKSEAFTVLPIQTPFHVTKY